MSIADLFGKTKGFIKALSDPGMVVVDISSDDNDIHDGKEFGFFVVLDLLIAVVLKQTIHLPRPFGKR